MASDGPRLSNTPIYTDSANGGVMVQASETHRGFRILVYVENGGVLWTGGKRRFEARSLNSGEIFSDWFEFDGTGATFDAAKQAIDILLGASMKTEASIFGVPAQIIGADGNAFNILGICSAAARRAGIAKEDIDAFMAEATAGDYDALLRTCMKYFDVGSVGDDEDGKWGSKEAQSVKIPVANMVKSETAAGLWDVEVGYQGDPLSYVLTNTGLTLEQATALVDSINNDAADEMNSHYANKTDLGYPKYQTGAVIITGGFRDGTLMNIYPMGSGMIALEMTNLASFSDFPYYFGSRNDVAKLYGSVDAAVRAVQNYLDKYGDGGVASVTGRIVAAKKTAEITKGDKVDLSGLRGDRGTSVGTVTNIYKAYDGITNVEIEDDEYAGSMFVTTETIASGYKIGAKKQSAQWDELETISFADSPELAPLDCPPHIFGTVRNVISKEYYYYSVTMLEPEGWDCGAYSVIYPFQLLGTCTSNELATAMSQAYNDAYKTGKR